MTEINIPIAILGATGYAGEGTVKALLTHPNFSIVHVGSDRLGGTALGDAIPELAGQCDLTLAEIAQKRSVRAQKRLFYVRKVLGSLPKSSLLC